MADALGAHMSIAGGLYRALERGREVGCSVVQIFLKNQLQWAARPYTQEDIRQFAAARKATGIRRVVGALDEVTSRTRGYRVRVLLENTAGDGATIGRSFEELAALLNGARAPERLGVCLDTCHLFAAGYDLRAREGYEDVMQSCARIVGLRHVRAFHLNDARAPLGSGLDRHEKIGRGRLDREAFRWLMRDPRFARVPMALETPKDPEPKADRAALALLRKLRAS